MNRIRKGIKWLLWGMATLVVFIGVANIVVILKSREQVVVEISEIKRANIALVLGTSKSTRYGNDNLFFKDRIKAAADLYHGGKVKHIIVSGDNRTAYYNEPQDMLEALVSLDVPTEDVTLDYVGLRTLDSIVRCKKIFDQNNIIIVTQKFHAYRAIFIANHYNIESQVYAANYESHAFASLLIREIVARSLAVIDLYLLNKSPKYLGEKETLDIVG